MIYLFTGGFLLVLLGALFWFLRFTARKLRIESAACPKCSQLLQGLAEPRCPECGWALEAGVLAAGGIPPRPRRWLGFVTLALSVPVGLLVALLMTAMWSSFLMTSGIIQKQTQFNRAVEVDFDSQHGLKVLASADYTEPIFSNKLMVGAVEVVLSSGGRDVASWKGTGPVLGAPLYGVDINGEDVVDSLRSQIPESDESSVARILHHPGDSEILGSTIVSFAAPTGAVSGHVLDSTGREMFDRGISTSHQGSSGAIPPSAIWYAPMLVVPLVFFFAFFLLGLRTLTRHRRLEPFAPA
ncbi:MAG: hypothetical protein CMJ53_11800 [Planctomycetaceae bacterium]|nr:hypothetical protein [Planctomycetaceae bacterium]